MASSFSAVIYEFYYFIWLSFRHYVRNLGVIMFCAAALSFVDLGLTLPLKAPYLYHLVSAGNVQPISVNFHTIYSQFSVAPKLWTCSTHLSQILRNLSSIRCYT